MRRYQRNEAELDSWKHFTREMYSAWDADPGYYALQSIRDSSQAKRAAIAWCTYYNLAIAAEASERTGDKFWSYLESVYDTAKRNSERRHFRGNSGRVALAEWRSAWPHPEDMADFAAADSIDGEVTYHDIRGHGRAIRQYGDYFYWKWCDLREVLGYGTVNMDGAAPYSPKTPQQGAVLIAKREATLGKRWAIDLQQHFDSPGECAHFVVPAVYDRIIAYGVAHRVPPRTTIDRKFNVQEAETVCCVYKQMASGKYTYGARTAKAVSRLESSTSRTAQRMRSELLDLSPFSREDLTAILAYLKE